MGKILLTATVVSHIARFHTPLIEALKLKGYEVHVAARNNLAEKPGLELKNVDEFFDIPFSRSPVSFRNFNAYTKLTKLINSNSYDIVHCNTPIGGVITRVAARKARIKGTKVFYTAHGFHFYKGAPIINWLIYYPIEKLLALYTDKLITINDEDRKIAKNNFKTKVYYSHGVGVSNERFYPYSDIERNCLRRELGYSEDEFILLCIGELNKNKNQETIIKSLANVISMNYKVRLLIAGNGPLYDYLVNLVRKIKVERNVVFLGYKADIERYINTCDALISVSQREGLPINVVEGMLCGKPIIASDNRGHRELVRNNETGYLVDSNNHYEISTSILKLCRDKNLGTMYGNYGKEIAQIYNTSSVIKELMKIYELSNI